MARLVTGSSAGAFGVGLFGSMSSRTTDYLQSQIQKLAGAGSFREELYQRSMKIFNNISSSAALQAADSILLHAEAAMGQDIIEELVTLTQFQQARPVMQGWIMEDPVIYGMWKKGQIDGYSDTYVDPEPGLVGEERTKYQTLMHGVMREHETQNWTMSLYADREADDTKEFSISRIAAILQSQERARYMLEHGEDDITSQYGAKL